MSGIQFNDRKLYDFLNDSRKPYQSQAMFEFRYPKLFDDNSFLIEQVNFPKIDTNTGYVYIDGYEIEIHSTPKFDKEVSFSMYVEEGFLESNDGKYKYIFDNITNINSITGSNTTNRLFNTIYDNVFNNSFLNLNSKYFKNKQIEDAYIIPLASSEYSLKSPKSKSTNVLTLHNAMLKSIVMSGGFSATSQALLKFDVTFSYSYFDIESKNLSFN